MTREEALNEIAHKTGTVEGTEELINDIYDDFERRTCESCKFWVFGNVNMYEGTCTNATSQNSYNNITDFDFGCLKWESKDD